MKLQRVIVLLLVLALVIGLEVVLMTKCSGGPETAEPTQTPAATEPAEATAAPTQPPAVTTPVPGYTSPPAPAAPNSGNNNTGTSTPTQAPAPTQAPTQAPPPTQAPTQAPPAGTVTASNSFSSDTGTGVNMTISWTATDMGNGTTRLTINGTVSSYSLQVMSQPVSISFSGYAKSLMGNSIDVSNNSISTNSLFSTTMDVATGTSGTMNVVWSYNGTYGSGENQVSLPTITASDYVYTD